MPPREPPVCEFYSTGDGDYNIAHSDVVIRVRRHWLCLLCIGAITEEAGRRIRDAELVQNPTTD